MLALRNQFLSLGVNRSDGNAKFLGNFAIGLVPPHQIGNGPVHLAFALRATTTTFGFSAHLFVGFDCWLFLITRAVYIGFFQKSRDFFNTGGFFHLLRDPYI